MYTYVQDNIYLITSIYLHVYMQNCPRFFLTRPASLFWHCAIGAVTLNNWRASPSAVYTVHGTGRQLSAVEYIFYTEKCGIRNTGIRNTGIRNTGFIMNR